MRGSAWVALLKRFPPAEQEKLMVVTGVGIEVAIQQILIIQEDYMLIRGRLAGSSDTGRVFIIPYDHIDHFGWQKPMKEEEITAIFPETGAALGAPRVVTPAEAPATRQAPTPAPVPTAEAAPGLSPAAAEAPAEEPAPVAAETPPPAAPLDTSGPGKPAVDKEALLERLRARIRPTPGKPK